MAIRLQNDLHWKHLCEPYSLEHTAQDLAPFVVQVIQCRFYTSPFGYLQIQALELKQIVKYISNDDKSLP
jgi:hypothetical protein